MVNYVLVKILGENLVSSWELLPGLMYELLE